MNRVSPREHPLYDRPFEFLLGLALFGTGVLVLAGWVITGSAEFAPNYLQISTPITVTYATISLAGGAMTCIGLVTAYRGDPVRGRGMEAAGQLFMVGLTSTYATRLLVYPDTPPPPRWSALILILTALSLAGLWRAGRLLQTNWRVTRVVAERREAVEGTG